MMTNTLRALATALLLSTTTITAATVMSVVPAMAEGVRAQVGAALKAAISEAEHGNGSAAAEKIREAESVGSLTATERAMIDKTKDFVAAKTGNVSAGGGSATAAKAKFANDYNAGHYQAVVGEDADLLRKFGAMDTLSQQIIAQAYYQMHDYNQCMRVARDMGHASQGALELLSRCAFESGDQAVVQSTLEQLVVDYNQSKYWSDLLDSAEQTPGISNPDTLDVFRMRLLTNTMKGASDYQTAAEIAIQLGFPTEGAAFAQKGIDLKLPNFPSGPRLLALAKTAAATDMASLPKTAAAAAAAKAGDADVKLGEDYWGMGRYKDAVDAIKAGLAKGASSPDEAQIRLAMAYVGLRDRESAVRALNAVSKTAPAHTLAIAKLWSIYARTH
jgi:tetratricopeptide (TPR) repeat protein